MDGSAPTRPRRSAMTSIALAATTKWKATAALFSVVVAAGLSAFTFGLDREGFPPINTPISVVSGMWFVDDATVVDDELVRPIEEQSETVEGVISIVGAPDTSPGDLEPQAASLAGHLAADEAIDTADVRSMLTASIDPSTGDEQERQTRFTRVALARRFDVLRAAGVP